MLYPLKKLNKFLCNIILKKYLYKEDVTIFYELDLQEVCQIFSCSELQLSSELELFNAAVDWINYKPQQRRKHMSTLLKLIRLPLLSDKGSVSKLYERTKLHEGTKLHEDTFARRQICTSG